MNILLLQPNFRKSEKSFPLGLGYIGAFLKQNGHNLCGADLSFCSPQEIFSLIKGKAIDVVGVSAMSYNFKNVINVCKLLKKDTNIPIVAGGPHITIFKEYIIRSYREYFDYLIVGEGEHRFLALVNFFEGKTPIEQVDNLIYFKNGDLAINGCCREEDNLDNFPFPDRGLFPLMRYKGMFTKRNYTQIITSRGCNHCCHYCPEPVLWKRWRGHSIGNVLEEIKLIMRNYGIKEFHIEDSNFFGGGTERVKEFCNRIIEENLDIKWQCPNGIPLTDLGDLSVFKLMARAGCYSVCLGIESFDHKIAEKMDRGCDFSLAERIVNAAHNANIEVTGYFIIGFPGQSKKSIRNDLFLSSKLKLDFLHYSIFHIIPGSLLFYEYYPDLGNNQLINKKITFSAVNIKTLRRIRFFSSLCNCFRPKTLIFILKNLIIIKNPFIFIRRAIVYLLGIDLKF